MSLCEHERIWRHDALAVAQIKGSRGKSTKRDGLLRQNLGFSMWGSPAHLALFVLVVAQCLGLTVAEMPDVCTQEEYASSRDELCPPVFLVSSLAFNPHGPGVESEVTVILQPSIELESGLTNFKLKLDIKLPDFKPPNSMPNDPDNAINKLLAVTPMNSPMPGEDPATAYNTIDNPSISTTAKFDTINQVLIVDVDSGTKLKTMDTEFRVCCLVLPISSPLNNEKFMLSAYTPTVLKVPSQPVKNSPQIDRGNYWHHLQIEFDPPLSMHPTSMSLTLRPANDLVDETRIIVYVPGITRVGGESGYMKFNTKDNDWMMFKHYGMWDTEGQFMTFFLREGVTIKKGDNVTIRTEPGEFVLPIEVPPNYENFTVEARSVDNVDNIVPKTPVMQSNAVPHVRMFVYSKLEYTDTRALAVVLVHLTFQTNRPMYAGTWIMLRLAGFRSEVVEVPILGEWAGFFTDSIAVYDMPKNELLLRVNKTLYSDEKPHLVSFKDMTLPPALYENDISLLIWNSDLLATRQSIELSPEVGKGRKLFVRSQVDFEPQVPEMASNIKFTLLPSIYFFQGDQIILHLYGFRCQKERVTLKGQDAFRIRDQEAHWDEAYSILIVTVAPQEIIGNEQALMLEIDIEQGFRLPDKLSRDDGILMIEGGGAFIRKEPLKKTPKIGPSKMITQSSLVFEPITPNAQLSMNVARIRFSFVVNCDILPNSTIYFKLGGLKREVTGPQSGMVELSGKNSPMFTDASGHWDSGTKILKVKMIDQVYIRTGKETTFFLEQDQYFKLPYAMYQDDPSLFMYIPEAGIHKQNFHKTTRVNREPKTFTQSELRYGAPGKVPYPNTVMDIYFSFQPNVELASGSVVELLLPGFSCPNTKIKLEEGKDYDKAYQLFAQDPPGHWYATWNQITQSLRFEVGLEKFIPTSDITIVKMSREEAGFRLPDKLEVNDERLIIASIENQIIKPEPVKESPLVVARTFQTSTFRYTPREKESTFLLEMYLQPTVPVHYANDIRMQLPGFKNILSKTRIHLTGRDANSILDAAADWNETLSTLTLKASEEQHIEEFSVLHLRIEESQGFILPRTLYANHSDLKIESLDNIKLESVKFSPMVGDGPFQDQKYCMYQYERGTRTTNPECRIKNCDPPLVDPCSAGELKRCDCDEISDQLQPLTVRGFQLYRDDVVGFMPISEPCTTDWQTTATFSAPARVDVNEGRSELHFFNISSIDTGHFRICVNHFGTVFDVGRVTVRPSCPAPLVMVEGTCVEYCPPNKIPVAGECQRDPVSMQPLDKQAVMVSVKMRNPSAITNRIWAISPENPERRYFVYRYTYELARILDANPDRFKVASISEGSVIVNTVFATHVEDTPDPEVATARSPTGLLSLLRALMADKSSTLYDSSFFKYIEPGYRPDLIPVRMCPDEKYRTMCPYMDTIISPEGGLTIFLVSILGVTGVIILVCAGAWRVDFDSIQKQDEEVYKEAQKDTKKLDPMMQAEYARSWIEGRHMGEDWQKNRSRNVGMSAITDIAKK